MTSTLLQRIAPLFYLCLFISLLSEGYAQQLSLDTLHAPITPLPQTMEVEHSAWVEDWTNNLDTASFISTLPLGVNTIHVFVGQLAYVNGVATINGYTSNTPDLPDPKSKISNPNDSIYQAKKHSWSNWIWGEKELKDLRIHRLFAPAGSGSFPNMAALTDFVTQCKAAGIVVKLSIGGQAGTVFGNSWSILTESNISDFANALVSICTTTTADGIDFDEELEDTNIATLAGKLAGAFKDLAPNLITSYCVYGGCDANGPWHETNTVFLQNAVTAQNWCAIDRVYVMTYYDGCSLSQNEGFMKSWNSWLSSSHGFTASRISAGVDPNDPTTSLQNGSLNAWIQFAASQGLGTAIWDDLGVNDYVDNDWGTQITNIYNSYLPAKKER